jgi:hypothetical protein
MIQGIVLCFVGPGSEQYLKIDIQILWFGTGEILVATRLLLLGSQNLTRICNPAALVS